MRIAHIALAKRSEGHPGGVPLFGHYLARCLGAQEFSWQDAPPHVQAGTGGQENAAMRLGNFLSGTGVLDGYDAIVVDGFWGRGIPLSARRPMFSVAHNTWRSIGRALSSPGAMLLGETQAQEYTRVPTVAVSDQTARDLRDLYGVTAAATIRNAVDLREFCPAAHPPNPEPLVLYPSDHYPKGGDIVQALRRQMPDVRFDLMGGGIGEEATALQRGDVFLSPSRTEGCSYARLQALACGLPVVASETGIFADGPAPDGVRVGTTVGEIASLDAWESALRETIAERESLGRAARAWAETNASLEVWADQWLQLALAYLP